MEIHVHATTAPSYLLLHGWFSLLSFDVLIDPSTTWNRL
jgi:hypothetical protein